MRSIRVLQTPDAGITEVLLGLMAGAVLVEDI
jgi:hypothetical protein